MIPAHYVPPMANRCPCRQSRVRPPDSSRSRLGGRSGSTVAVVPAAALIRHEYGNGFHSRTAQVRWRRPGTCLSHPGRQRHWRPPSVRTDLSTGPCFGSCPRRDSPLFAARTGLGPPYDHSNNLVHHQTSGSSRDPAGRRVRREARRPPTAGSRVRRAPRHRRRPRRRRRARPGPTGRPERRPPRQRTTTRPTRRRRRRRARRGWPRAARSTRS